MFSLSIVTLIFLRLAGEGQSARAYNHLLGLYNTKSSLITLQMKRRPEEGTHHDPNLYPNRGGGH